MHIAGKTLVVTGGGNGIGREVVLQLLKAGARVAAVDVSQQGLEETQRLARRGVQTLTTHAVDLTDRQAVAALPAEIEAVHGPVDGVVHVAGIIQPFVRLVDLDYADIERVLAVNLWGTIHVAKAFLPDLRQRPEACLVNVSSMGAFVSVPGQSVYCASKTGVGLLTEALYAELRGTSVAVTAVYPGGVDTDIAEHSHAELPGGPGNRNSIDDLQANLTAPDEAASQIVAGIEKGSFRVVIGRDAHTLDGLSRVSRRRATEMVAARMGALLGS